MKTGVIIYDGFAHFEISLLSYLMKTKGDIITIAMSTDDVTSEEGFIIKPHRKISENLVNELDALIIPGGGEEEIISNLELRHLIANFNKNDKVIGAICSAVLVIAEAGVLEGNEFTSSIPKEEFQKYENSVYKDANVITSRNIITAKANGYIDFAIEVGSKMNIFEDQDDLNETINFFKHFGL